MPAKRIKNETGNNKKRGPYVCNGADVTVWSGTFGPQAMPVARRTDESNLYTVKIHLSERVLEKRIVSMIKSRYPL